MQMTPSPIKRDNVNMNKLLTGIRASMDLYLQNFEMKSSTAFHR